MQNGFKCNHNLNTITVFSCIEGIMTHLANIDTRTNRIYTTKDGYEFLATPLFKMTHTMKWFDADIKPEDAPYRKFTVSVEFDEWDLDNVVLMCSRPLVF